MCPADDDDMHCSKCRKQVKEVSQLVMCAGCDKIFHAGCYFQSGRSGSFRRGPKTITCRDHAFFTCDADNLCPPASPKMNKDVLSSLLPLQAPARPNLDLPSPLSFDSTNDVYNNADDVITPEYASQNHIPLFELVEFNEEDMHKLEQAKLETIGSKFLLGI